MDQAEAEQNNRTDGQNPLERMAARTRAAASAANSAFDGAIRVAFGRMARTRRGLDAAVTSVKMSPASLAEVVEIAEPGMFLSLLEGDGDRIGLAVMCHSLMAGLVEAVTTARVADTPPNPRKPTRTDAALLAPLLDTLFQQISQRLAVAGGAAALFDGYVYGSFLDDPRPLGVLLEDVPYQILRLRVEFDDGPREGKMYLVLPDVGQDQGTAGPGQDTTRQAQWTAQLEATVCAAEVQLDAVLCRMQMKLSAVSTLKRGDVLCLPESALEALSLETLKGHVVAKARLGQARGQRAVRLTTQPGETPEDYDVPFTLPVSAARVLPAGPFDADDDDAGYDVGIDTDTETETDTDTPDFAMPDAMPMQPFADDLAPMPDGPADAQ
ncbi:FliM/FliN family flagellar motor switch protein [Roseinatronobacter sp.]